MTELPMVLQDETGSPSSARFLLWITVGFTLVAIVLDATGRWNVTGEVWGLLTVMVLAFTGWAGGPRVMQYLGPQLGALASAVTAGKRRSEHQPNVWKDDERDPEWPRK